MKKSRCTEQQIAFALQQAETGTSVEEVCRKLGVSQATFFRWKKVYGGLMPSEVPRLKSLEAENTRLRQPVADLTLDKERLSEVIKKRSDVASRPRDDRLSAHLLQSLGETGLSCRSRLPSHIPLPRCAHRSGGPAQTHPGDCRDTGAAHGYRRVHIVLRREYNEVRPHSAIDNRSPIALIQKPRQPAEASQIGRASCRERV